MNRRGSALLVGLLGIASCRKHQESDLRPHTAQPWMIPIGANRVCAELAPCPKREPGEGPACCCSLEGKRVTPPWRVGAMTVEHVDCRFLKMGDDDYLGIPDDRSKPHLHGYDLLHAVEADATLHAELVTKLGSPSPGHVCALGERDNIGCATSRPERLIPVCAKNGATRMRAAEQYWGPGSYLVASDRIRSGDALPMTTPLTAGGRKVIVVMCSGDNVPSFDRYALDGDTLSEIETNALLDRLDSIDMQASLAHHVLRDPNNTVVVDPAPGARSPTPSCTRPPGPQKTGSTMVFYATSTNAGTPFSRCDVDTKTWKGACREVAPGTFCTVEPPP